MTCTERLNRNGGHVVRRDVNIKEAEDNLLCVGNIPSREELE